MGDIETKGRLDGSRGNLRYGSLLGRRLRGRDLLGRCEQGHLDQHGDAYAAEQRKASLHAFTSAATARPAVSRDNHPSRSSMVRVPYAALASEEASTPETADASAPILIAYDPLDGSSNIETNMTVGTIFSILPNAPGQTPFTARGSEQLAAGFVVYGPQTSLILTSGDGVDMFTLDREHKIYRLIRKQVQIPAECAEYAINASNHRHWEPPVRAFIDQCVAGADGPSGKNFNMRWIASLVAEAYRILIRGGVFLYPSDVRKGYAEGRLRLLYEAHPMAFIVEQAGGAATDGAQRILDIVPTSLHQRVPVFLGSKNEVERVTRYHSEKN